VFVKYQSDRAIYGWDTTTYGSENKKGSHLTPVFDTISPIYIILVKAIVYGLPKFEISSFSRSAGSQNSIVGHVTPPLDPVWPNVYIFC